LSHKLPGASEPVSTLRSLDGSKDVSFHTFFLPEDHFVHLLVKNLGRHMPEDIIQEEVENLGISVCPGSLATPLRAL
jgi:hypothetical protein